MRRKKPRKKHGVTQLRMTSMMDILVVLLLFLIKSFVADEQMNPAAGVTLPESTSQERPEDSVVVAITDSSILVGEDWVMDLTALDDSEEMLLIPLADHLRDVRSVREDIARLQGEDPNLGRVTIQGDREIEFAVLQRVMYTIGAEGFEEVSLAVIRTT